MLSDILYNDLNESLKSKQDLKVSVLRMALAAIHNKEIEKRSSGAGEQLNDEEIINILRSEIKKRKDAIELYLQGGRKDLADKEAAEIKILELYLPQPLTKEEVENIIEKVLVNNQLNQKTFGKIIGLVVKEVKGRFDAKEISKMLQERINNNL
ncbi:MAG: GatB/YqeY domain-containing protein [Minisyncoccia bacterium]